jgi:protein-tyrosine kinase
MNSVPNKGLTDQFRTIATNILFSIPDHPQKTILVTSAAAEEGKSLLAVNLAIILARIGKRILLIDADMRNPKIHSMLKLKRSPGLSDILAGQTQLSSALQYANIQGLYAIPAGTRTPNPVELLISQRMATFVQFMREKFDFIIIDTTPVMMLSDPLVLAPLVDGVVVVVRSGVTPRPAIKKAVEQLQRINAMIVGAVLNDHDIKREGYYSYHYYRKYYHRYYGHDEKAPQVRSRA